ncbi:hypothetical protein FRC17_010371 [Serendipita sp. 399]|nr:hypothetical protein FRC17_010371 [Serendipita sp. 399]
MIRLVETTKELCDEARWALHSYHAHYTRGDELQPIQQAQELMAVVQEKWDEWAELLVESTASTSLNLLSGGQDGSRVIPGEMEADFAIYDDHRRYAFIIAM